jgi:hypothetical protein
MIRQTPRMPTVHDLYPLGSWTLVAVILATIVMAIAMLGTKAHAAKPYDVCSGVLRQDHGKLLIGFEEEGEPVEGACLLPVPERNRILQACKLQQPCTVIGITKLTCGPDCTNMVTVISVFAGNIKE